MINTQDFLSHYLKSPNVLTVIEHLQKTQNLALKGISGSFEAILAASLLKQTDRIHLFIMHDLEEANYFINDLSNFCEVEDIFPSSYKKPYQYEEVDSANILQRTEILNKLNNYTAGAKAIVTFPEALSEKVINKRSLGSNTFNIEVGEELDIGFLEELLHSYDFEKTDFVYEAGQFSVRGGIVDIYSYSHELPYRLEFLGDEIESIREFNPTASCQSKF